MLLLYYILHVRYTTRQEIYEHGDFGEHLIVRRSSRRKRQNYRYSSLLTGWNCAGEVVTQFLLKTFFLVYTLAYNTRKYCTLRKTEIGKYVYNKYQLDPIFFLSETTLKVENQRIISTAYRGS